MIIKHTSIHRRWESTELQDTAITFSPNLWNVGINLATLANSVVHTGVKSFGWENKIPQLKIIVDVKNKYGYKF